MRLTIEVAETKDEDGDFMARIVEHPGLTAFGPTQADALREIATVLIGVSQAPQAMKNLTNSTR